MASKSLKSVIKKKQELVKIERENILSKLDEIRAETDDLVKEVCFYFICVVLQELFQCN